MHRLFVSIVLALAVGGSAFAQSGWSTSVRGAAFGIHNTEAGPETPRTENFSTNWLELRSRYTFANGFFAGIRGRGSAEPTTIKEAGYPQLLQYVSAQGGGPLVDRMRARDTIEEAGVDVGWRWLRVTVAPIGEPTLGPRPYGVRESSMDLAVAPFAYDVQESYHVKTNVMNAALETKYVRLEGGVFHDVVSTGRHTSIPSGGSADSSAYRLTVMPADRVSFQVSRGTFGENDARKISSASFGYDGSVFAATAMYTRREEAGLPSLDAMGVEVAIRASRNSIAGRFENVDRPSLGVAAARRTGHATFAYVFDAIARPTWRAGVGLNVDYHTNSRALTGGVYGHKPQTIYFFARIRSATRPILP